jgi:hypothetical protein
VREPAGAAYTTGAENNPNSNNNSNYNSNRSTYDNNGDNIHEPYTQSNSNRNHFNNPVVGTPSYAQMYSSASPPQPTGGNGFFQHFYKYLQGHTLMMADDIPPHFSPALFNKQHHCGGHPSKQKLYTRKYFVADIDFGLNLQPVDACRPIDAPFQMSLLISIVSNWTTVNIGLNKAESCMSNLNMIDLLREFFGFYFWFPEVR